MADGYFTRCEKHDLDVAAHFGFTTGYDGKDTADIEHILKTTKGDMNHVRSEKPWRRMFLHMGRLVHVLKPLRHNVPAMSMAIRMWAVCLRSYGYRVEDITKAYRMWLVDSLDTGEDIDVLEHARLAMENALGAVIPEVSLLEIPAVAQAPDRERSVVVISSDENEKSGWQICEDTEHQSPNNEWPGICLEVGGRPELRKPSYVCNRCRQPGHRIEYCPTNLDPNFDRPPPADYKCGFCGSKNHFLTACPRNTRPESLNQQRIRAGIIRQPSPHPPSFSIKMEAQGSADEGPCGPRESKDQPLEGSSDHRRTPSPRGRSYRYRSRSPLRNRTSKPVVEPRFEDRRRQGSQYNLIELKYDDDESADDADRRPTSGKNSGRNLDLPRLRDEGRLSFYDEDESAGAFKLKTTKRDAKHLARDAVDDDEVEITGSRPTPKKRTKTAHYAVEPLKDSKWPGKAKKSQAAGPSSKAASVHPQRQSFIDPSSPIPDRPESSTTQNQASITQNQVDATMTTHPQHQSLIDKISPRRHCGASMMMHPDRARFLAQSKQPPRSPVKLSPRVYQRDNSPVVADSDSDRGTNLSYFIRGAATRVADSNTPTPTSPAGRSGKQTQTPTKKTIELFPSFIDRRKNKDASAFPQRTIPPFCIITPKKKTDEEVASPGSVSPWPARIIDKPPNPPLVGKKPLSLEEKKAEKETIKKANATRALELLRGSIGLNPRKNRKRPTALEMWDELDREEAEAEAVKSASDDGDATMAETDKVAMETAKSKSDTGEATMAFTKFHRGRASSAKAPDAESDELEIQQSQHNLSQLSIREQTSDDDDEFEDFDNDTPMI